MENLVERRRHSAAHALAMAAQRLFPNVKLGIGPVTNNGFYHDFEFPHPISWEDVKNIEAEINLILQANLPFNKVMVSRDQAFSILMTRGQVYKSELLQEIPDEEVSFYQTGEEFIDLCRGPHVESTGKIGVIKLLELSDTNWKNDTDRPQMQRITGVAFGTVGELTQYMQRLEAIKTRDYRRYLEDMELAIEVNNEFVYTPHGTTVLNLMHDQIIYGFNQQGFEKVLTSAKQELKAQTEDLDAVYEYKIRSYRHLPLRLFAEQRLELPNGYKINSKPIYRAYEIITKTYAQSSSLLPESRLQLQLILDVADKLNLKIDAQLITADQELNVFKYLSEMLTQRGISQTQVISADKPAQALTLEIFVEDSLKRKWSIAELDYATKQREYINEQGEETPTHEFTIHFVLEEILAYLLEEGEGGLPFKLSPIQCLIVPISSDQVQYAQYVQKLLADSKIRAGVDNSSETMQAKIREAELAHIPAILVIGEKEVNAQAVSVRLHDDQELGLIGEDILISTLQEAFDRSEVA